MLRILEKLLWWFFKKELGEWSVYKSVKDHYEYAIEIKEKLELEIVTLISHKNKLRKENEELRKQVKIQKENLLLCSRSNIILGIVFLVCIILILVYEFTKPCL